MITKYEGVGVAAGLGIMAIALYLLRLDGIGLYNEENMNLSLNQSQTALLVAGTEGNRESNLLETLNKASDERGRVNRLIIDDIVYGTGREVSAGDTITVHYKGTFTDGEEFDNSRRNGQPFTFTIGRGQVIEGWERGLIGMKTGGQRILVIPSSMGYGDRTVGPIPAGSTLVFTVELLAIQ